MVDNERISRVKGLMAKQGIDVLFCSLPENVLYLTGYWPVMGSSTVVFPLDGEPTVLLPFEELDYAAEGWVTDLRTFHFISLEHAPRPALDRCNLMRALWPERGYGRKTIGYENDFELIAGNNLAAEARVITPKSMAEYREAAPQSTWVDASTLLRTARMVKSAAEIAQIRTTSEIASMGLDAARDTIAAGVTEAEVAGAVEGRIYGRGVGYKNVTRARGYCFVMSGVNGANAWRPFCVSSGKRLQVGEPVLVELGAMSNGYFVDVTRTFFVGPLNERVTSFFEVVEEAVNTVVAHVRPGVPVSHLDAVARRVIEKAGYDEQFGHQLGHGIGLQLREPPSLHPASDEMLDVGMTVAIEPAIYIPGFGGIRLKENLVVTPTGCEIITPYPQRSELLFT